MTYSTTSTLSAVVSALETAISAAVPALAPSVPYTLFADTTCDLQNLSDPEGRIRQFEVRSESPTYGMLSWGANVSSIERVLRIRVGYPLSAYYPEAPDEVTAENERFKTSDLKNEDFRQILKIVEGDGLIQALSGVALVLLRGEQDEAGGRVRSILYGVQYVETYA